MTTVIDSPVWAAFQQCYPAADLDSLESQPTLLAAWEVWQQAWRACDKAAAQGAAPFGYFWYDEDDTDGPSSGVCFGNPEHVLDGDQMLPLYTRPITKPAKG